MIHWVPMLVPPRLVVNSHNDFVPVDVDVPLHQRHRLRENIVAGTDEVDVEHLVVPHRPEGHLAVPHKQDQINPITTLQVK